MKKNNKVVIGVLLIIIIALLVFITIILNKSTNIFKLNENKEQLSTEDGLISTSEHLASIAEAEEKTYEKLTAWSQTATASASGLSFGSGAKYATKVFGVSATYDGDDKAELDASNFACYVTSITFNSVSGSKLNSATISSYDPSTGNISGVISVYLGHFGSETCGFSANCLFVRAK